MRIAIVNDQRLATEALRRIVLSNQEHQIAWTAADGREAVEKCRQDLPDAILMDLVMPVMNGAEATREIMLSCPCPVLVVTATISGNYSLVCEALSHGAYDAICTPTLGDQSPQESGANLLMKLKSVADICQESAESNRPGVVTANQPPPPSASPVSDSRPIVAIGASTGGPQALEQIISPWPADFPAAVVVVQHIAEEFASSLTQWLQDRSQLSVRPVGSGDAPRPGMVLVASTNDHLVLNADRRLGYTPSPIGLPYRPSVDVFYGSLAEHWPTPSVAVVLTGIGRDGAKGLLLLRQRGWHTIAQDEQSSVVYGMPQAAAELGAAKRILPLHEISAHISGHVARLV